jgi:hypothetical protein
MSEIHVAGPLVEWVQRCSRCGYVLNDYRNSMIPEGDPPPRGWAVGVFVEVVDCGTFRASTVTDDLPTCDHEPEPEPERERDDDDGRTYADPRDERDERARR